MIPYVWAQLKHMKGGKQETEHFDLIVSFHDLWTTRFYNAFEAWGKRPACLRIYDLQFCSWNRLSHRAQNLQRDQPKLSHLLQCSFNFRGSAMQVEFLKGREWVSVPLNKGDPFIMYHTKCRYLEIIPIWAQEHKTQHREISYIVIWQAAWENWWSFC